MKNSKKRKGMFSERQIERYQKVHEELFGKRISKSEALAKSVKLILQQVLIIQSPNEEALR